MTRAQRVFIQGIRKSHGKRIANRVLAIIDKGEGYVGAIGRYNGSEYFMIYIPGISIDIF